MTTSPESKWTREADGGADGMMKASARKSFGAYKPLIIHPDGRTEILGKRVRPLIWVPGQAGMHPLPGGPVHNVRGKTFPNRADAIAYAQRTVDMRAQGLAAHHKRRAAYLAKSEGR